MYGIGESIAATSAQAQQLTGALWSAKQAHIDRDWQQTMSGTAHQREVQDLVAAGLNPILSATGGRGASTGGGAMGSWPGGADPVSAAMAYRSAKLSQENLQWDTVKKREEAGLTRSLANRASLDFNFRHNAQSELQEQTRQEARRDAFSARNAADIESSRYGVGLQVGERLLPFGRLGVGAAK